jgi:hypothetical protein
MNTSKEYKGEGIIYNGQNEENTSEYKNPHSVNPTLLTIENQFTHLPKASNKYMPQIEVSKEVPKIPKMPSVVQSPKLKGKIYTDMPISMPKNQHNPPDKGKSKDKKLPDTHGIEFAKNPQNVARFVKNEFGGYFLIHNGYKYIKRPGSNASHADIWICENGQNDEEIKCPASVLLNKLNRIEEKVPHIKHELPQMLAEKETFPTYKDPLSAENMKQLEEGKWIYHDGYTYRREHNYSNTNKTRLHFGCVKDRKHRCNGRATIDVGTGLNVIMVTMQHNHSRQELINGNFLTYPHLGMKYLWTALWRIFYFFPKRIKSKIEFDGANVCSRANL